MQPRDPEYAKSAKIDERPVCLEDMLSARENRRKQQHALIQKHGCPLVCFTVNTPGPIKDCALYRAAFEEGIKQIDAVLFALNMPVRECLKVLSFTGNEAYWAVHADPHAVKKELVWIEEHSAIGRFFDIDVLGPDGGKIGRSDVGMRDRTCFLCENQAAACARSRAHPVPELVSHIKATLTDYFDQQYADQVAAYAARCLLYEVAVTPKPGLVDRANCGSHSDMDFFTFIDSASVLTPYFRKCALSGLHARSGGPEDVFAAIRVHGMEAESDMYRATNGVNTHKGAIFSMGILCAAGGYVGATGDAVSVESICAAASAMVSPYLRKYARDTGAGLSGARAEAANGFSFVRSVSLPLLGRLLSESAGPNAAGVAVLLTLIAAVDDTNMVRRGGAVQAKEIARDIAAHLRDHKGPPDRYAKELDTAFIRQNLSPGGCADLLAVTFFLHGVETGQLASAKWRDIASTCGAV